MIKSLVLTATTRGGLFGDNWDMKSLSVQAILGGQRDPACLARLRDPRCRHDEATIAKALQGNWRAEHLFALRQAVVRTERL